MRSGNSALKPGSENAEVMEAVRVLGDPKEGLVARLKRFFSIETGPVTYGVISKHEYPEYEGRSLQIKIGKWLIEFSLLKEGKA